MGKEENDELKPLRKNNENMDENFDEDLDDELTLGHA
jgi:hypothetical protein